MAACFKDVFPDVDAVLRMPPEELAVYVLKFLRGAQQDNTGMLNRHNFTHPGGYIHRYTGGARAEAVARTLTEAWMWLEREGMLAPQPGRADRDWVYITSKGEAYKTDADVSAYRHQRLLRDQALDPELVEKVLPLFRPDDYDTPVFKAFKIVEIRVRRMSGLPDTMVGIDLMRTAFHLKTGPLADPRLPDPEREAMAHFFAGAVGLFRNPSGHRDHVKTAEEAAGRILCANLLLSLLAGLPQAQPGTQS
jgi:uncharacterized protein (TIGR02391 family)